MTIIKAIRYTHTLFIKPFAGWEWSEGDKGVGGNVDVHICQRTCKCQIQDSSNMHFYSDVRTR